MNSKYFDALLFTAILAIVLFSAGCSSRDLRGWWTNSADGKTYFVLDDPDGRNCPPFFIDGERWPAQIGEKREIKPGIHDITCGEKFNSDNAYKGVGFEVPEGTTYTFDYWGP